MKLVLHSKDNTLQIRGKARKPYNCEFSSHPLHRSVTCSGRIRQGQVYIARVAPPVFHRGVAQPEMKTLGRICVDCALKNCPAITIGKPVAA
jgi:hypothetical protein